MGRPLLYPDHMLAQFPAQTFDRIIAVLRDKEDRATFIRRAVEAELKRRERLTERRKAVAPRRRAGA